MFWTKLTTLLILHCRVTVTLIQVDPETDEPLTAGDVLDNLDDSDAIGIAAAQLEADVNGESVASAVPVWLEAMLH